MTPFSFVDKKSSIDWPIFAAAVGLALLGLLTMNSFTSQDPFFLRQSTWILLGIVVFLFSSSIDWRFLRRSGVAASIYGILILPLIFLLLVGEVIQGARSWISIGSLGIEPVEFAKLALIIALAKYFSRRHIEIKNFRHILVSGAYAGALFVLVALQPDFGSAIIIALLWLAMVLMSGLSRTHLVTLLIVGVVAFGGLWFFGFEDYQKQRIMTFVNPTVDIHGAGYNAYQSTVAFGSGELFGKGIGYGTQSKLRFLPEYQTDFIFAAFAEEWGFFGVMLVFMLFAIIFWRLTVIAMRGATNFEVLFSLGVLFYFAAHFTLHAGINMGLLPVTGTTIPFMSYGGSHILTEFLALGMVCGMNRYSRAAHAETYEQEFSGGYDQ